MSFTTSSTGGNELRSGSKPMPWRSAYSEDDNRYSGFEATRMTPEIRVAPEDRLFVDESQPEVAGISASCTAGGGGGHLGRDVVVSPYCRSPSPTGRRLSAPGASGSPSRRRRCSTEEPYVFSMAQAAAAAAAAGGGHYQLHIAAAAVRGQQVSDNASSPPNSSSLDAAISTTFPEAATTAADIPKATTSQPRTFSSMSFDFGGCGSAAYPRCVVDPPPGPSSNEIPTQSRWSSRALSLPQCHPDLSPLRIGGSSLVGGESVKLPPTIESERGSVECCRSNIQLVTAAVAAQRNFDLLCLPGGAVWTPFDETGQPRRRHSVASGRDSGPLESIAEETSGGGSAAAGSSSGLLLPKASTIRRYSIPENISASRASGSDI